MAVTATSRVPAMGGMSAATPATWSGVGAPVTTAAVAMT